MEGANSGVWGPGPPGGPDPNDAQLGVYFEDAALGITGTGALRDSFISFHAFPVALGDLGGGVSGFSSFLQMRFAGGALDWQTNIAGIEGRAFLDTTIQAFSNQPGTLEQAGDGTFWLTQPFDFSLQLAPSTIDAPIPVFVDLDISGQIVAHTVPEPGVGSLLLLELTGFGRRRRLRARRSSAGI